MMRKQLANNPDLNRWFHFLVRLDRIRTLNEAPRLLSVLAPI